MQFPVTQMYCFPCFPALTKVKALWKAEYALSILSYSVSFAGAVLSTLTVHGCRSTSVWDKQHGVDMETKRLVNHTRQLVAQGQPLGSNLWHTALHAEHARPMFQVGSITLQH